MNQDVSEVPAIEAIRATLAYNQIQDRISLTCAVNTDECVVLWLTARLASQLVPHLCQAVSQLPDETSGGDGKETEDNDPATLAQKPATDATSKADGGHNPNPEVPVVAGADSAAWVVTAIDLTNGPMLVQLRFRDDQGHAPVLLSLEHTQLAEWSEGFKRCYAQAGWPMDCWQTPVSAGTPNYATQRVALH